MREELQMETREDRASGQAWGDLGNATYRGRTRGLNWGQAEILQIRQHLTSVDQLFHLKWQMITLSSLAH